MTNYLITGTNRGIGLELCKQLVAQGNKVFATCRNSSNELSQSGATVIAGVDINDDACSAKIIESLAGTKVDILINNSGVWGGDTLDNLDKQNLAKVIETNAISPLLLTEKLLPHLADNAKVIMMTSRMGSIEDNTSGGRYSYRMSKAALNAAAKSLAIDLKPRGITVGIIHPGHVATDMGGPNGISVSDAAQNILQRIDEYNLENSGGFWHANGEILPW